MLDKNATWIKDLQVGDKLYDFWLNDDGRAEMQEVYVIKMNQTNFYFGYAPDSRIDRRMRLKVGGTLPKLWKPNPLETHYIADDKGFGKAWAERIKQRKYYKGRIDHIKNTVFYRDDVNELKDLYETIERFEKTKHANRKNVFF